MFGSAIFLACGLLGWIVGCAEERLPFTNMMVNETRIEEQQQTQRAEIEATAQANEVRIQATAQAERNRTEAKLELSKVEIAATAQAEQMEHHVFLNQQNQTFLTERRADAYQYITGILHAEQVQRTQRNEMMWNTILSIAVIAVAGYVLARVLNSQSLQRGESRAEPAPQVQPSMPTYRRAAVIAIAKQNDLDYWVIEPEAADSEPIAIVQLPNGQQAKYLLEG